MLQPCTHRSITRQKIFTYKCRLLFFPIISILISGCSLPWNSGNDANSLILSGTVDAREVTASFLVNGRLSQLQVNEGDTVRREQPIAHLVETDFELAVKRAEAEVEIAKQTLAELEAGTRPQEIAIAEAAETQAQSQLVFAEAEVQRINALIPKQLASQEQLERLQLEYNIAWSALEQAQLRLALLREGPRQEEIKRARAQYSATQIALQTAKRQLDYSRLTSPVDGIVSVRLAEAGEVVAAGQAIVRISELAKPWVRVYLREADLPHIKLGQEVEVRADGLPDKKFKGRVGFISPEAEFTPKTVETHEVRVDLVYRVKVEVDNPEGILKIGMPADVTFNGIE